MATAPKVALLGWAAGVLSFLLPERPGGGVTIAAALLLAAAALLEYQAIRAGRPASTQARPMVWVVGMAFVAVCWVALAAARLAA